MHTEQKVRLFHMALGVKREEKPHLQIKTQPPQGGKRQGLIGRNQRGGSCYRSEATNGEISTFNNLFGAVRAAGGTKIPSQTLHYSPRAASTPHGARPGLPRGLHRGRAGRAAGAPLLLPGSARLGWARPTASSLLLLLLLLFLLLLPHTRRGLHRSSDPYAGSRRRVLPTGPAPGAAPPPARPRRPQGGLTVSSRTFRVKRGKKG